MLDRCQREIREGSVVDLQLSGMYSAVVVGVVDMPRVILGGQPQMPCVMVQMQLTLPSQDGRTANCYVVKDAAEFMPKVETEGIM